MKAEDKGTSLAQSYLMYRPAISRTAFLQEGRTASMVYTLLETRERFFAAWKSIGDNYIFCADRKFAGEVKSWLEAINRFRYHRNRELQGKEFLMTENQKKALQIENDKAAHNIEQWNLTTVLETDAEGYLHIYEIKER